MKKACDELCEKNSLSIAQKGQHADGAGQRVRDRIYRRKLWSMNLNEMPQYQKENSMEEQINEKAMQDTADLKSENKALRNTQEAMKREMDQLRKKLKEVKVTQKVVYRDHIVRAMVC